MALVSPTLPPLDVMLGLKAKFGLMLVSPRLPPVAEPPVPLPVPLPVAVLSPLALLAVWLPLAPPVALTSPLVPPVALLVPELVMLIDGVEPEPLPEPRPTT